MALPHPLLCLPHLGTFVARFSAYCAAAMRRFVILDVRFPSESRSASALRCASVSCLPSAVHNLDKHGERASDPNLLNTLKNILDAPKYSMKYLKYVEMQSLWYNEL